MTTPSIADLLKYADLQMAAEAFLVNASGELVDPKTALMLGNEHASKFTATQADAFLDPNTGWTVVTQSASTPTGFSGTLFRNNQTGELVMSFRSTEFIDDAARDNQATNTLEIAEHGFAFGQIADMEAWYSDLKSQGIVTDPSQLSVTGYSLGGHLATVFNLLRAEEGEDLKQVVTFNGAGVGTWTTDSLSELIEQFNDLRSVPGDVSAAWHFSIIDPDLAALFDRVRESMNAGQGFDVSDNAQLQAWAYQGNGEAGTQPPSLEVRLQAQEILKAIGNVQTILEEVERLRTDVIAADGSKPKVVDGSQIAQANLDYQMAMLIVSKNTDANSILGNGLQAFLGKEFGGVLSNQIDVVGATSPSAVANSNYHWGEDVQVFIEDQPLWRGGAVTSALLTSLQYAGVKLLTSGYPNNDFGDTHSLVPLVDSLKVQNTLLQLLPQGQRQGAMAELNNILQLASYLKKEDGDLVGDGQGKAEGDVLENVVNSLADLILGAGSFERLAGSASGGTWEDIDDREQLHLLLQRIVDDGSEFFRSAESLTLALQATGPILAEKARSDFGAYMALHSLSPFALVGLTKDKAQGLSIGGSDFDVWLSDQDAATPEERQITDVWLKDRATFLQGKNWFAQKNLDPVNPGYDQEAATPTTMLPSYLRDNVMYVDEASGYSIAQGFSPDSPFNGTKVHYFGDDNDNEYEGKGSDDFLFGGAGNDRLSGKYGKDYLEGGSGNDVLDGGESDDQLVGGNGDDTYVFDGQFGKDSVVDSDASGHIEIKGQSIGDVKGDGTGGWRTEFDDGTRVVLRLLDDARSSTGKILKINIEGDSSNTITIKNFDERKARGETGYLGIRLGDFMLAVTEAGADLGAGQTNANYWSDLSANLSDLDGKSSSLKEGAARSFLISLDQAAKAGDTVTLNLSGLQAQAILGDRKVDANGAVITLQEGQTTVSVALVADGEISADVLGGLSVTYQSGSESLTSNTWGLTVKDAGEAAKTFIGDQRAQLWGVELQPEPVVDEEGNVTQDVIGPDDPRYNTYAWSKTEWAADGTLTGGVAQVDFNDVIAGTDENDKIQGLGGNDALDGRAGDDRIEGGDGDDVIGGGEGSDNIRGGAGNDFILSAHTLTVQQRRGVDDTWNPPGGELVLIQGSTWGVYVGTNGVEYIAGAGPAAINSASDVIDAGDGNDLAITGNGGDRVDGAAGCVARLQRSRREASNDKVVNGRIAA